MKVPPPTAKGLIGSGYGYEVVGREGAEVRRKLAAEPPLEFPNSCIHSFVHSSIQHIHQEIVVSAME